MLRVRRGEGCLVIYVLVASFKEEKRKINVCDAWFRVSPISLTLRAGLLVCGCHLPSFDFGSVVVKFVFCSVFVFRSDQIGFSLFFIAKVTDWPKNYFNYFFFFWQISSTFPYALILSAKTLFSILKKVSAPTTFGDGLVDARWNHYFVCTVN